MRNRTLAVLTVLLGPISLVADSAGVCERGAPCSRATDRGDVVQGGDVRCFNRRLAAESSINWARRLVRVGSCLADMTQCSAALR